MPRSTESASAGSRRGWERRRIRRRIGDEVLIKLFDEDVEDVDALFDGKRPGWIARYIIDRLLPDYVIDAIEERRDG